MATEKPKKVMDVANPEDAKTEIGSKPMIVGHKAMASDPMVREKEAEEANSSPEVEKEPIEQKQTETKLEPPSAKQKTIVPISEQKETVENKVDTSAEAKPAVVVEDKKPEVVDQTKESNNDDAKETAKLDPTAEAMERETALRKIIESKKYNVNIKQARGSKKGFIWIILGLAATGIIGLYALADSGKLDLGFEVPFSILGSENETSQQTTSPEPKSSEETEEIKQADQELSVETTIDTSRWTEFSSVGYSFKIPDGWELMQKEGNTGSLFASSVKYKEGVKAVVENYDVASSPLEAMFMIVLDNTSKDKTQNSACLVDSKKYESSYSFMNDSGDTIFATIEKGTIPEEQRPLGEVAQGETQYAYCVAIETREIRISYLIDTGVDDEHEYLEAAMKTLKFIDQR